MLVDRPYKNLSDQELQEKIAAFELRLKDIVNIAFDGKGCLKGLVKMNEEGKFVLNVDDATHHRAYKAPAQDFSQALFQYSCKPEWYSYWENPKYSYEGTEERFEMVRKGAENLEEYLKKKGFTKFQNLMPSGAQFIRALNEETGETKIVRIGLHNPKYPDRRYESNAVSKHDATARPEATNVFFPWSVEIGDDFLPLYKISFESNSKFMRANERNEHFKAFEDEAVNLMKEMALRTLSDNEEIVVGIWREAIGVYPDGKIRLYDFRYRVGEPTPS